MRFSAPPSFFPSSLTHTASGVSPILDWTIIIIIIIHMIIIQLWSKKRRKTERRSVLFFHPICIREAEEEEKTFVMADEIFTSVVDVAFFLYYIVALFKGSLFST